MLSLDQRGWIVGRCPVRQSQSQGSEHAARGCEARRARSGGPSGDPQQLPATALIGGRAQGPLLHASVGLSFWGGVDPRTGTVLDHTHPLFGESISGKILAIPSGRGSCTGSQVMLELALNGAAPAAILLREADAILALGVIVAEELFGRSIPIAALGSAGFDAVAGAECAALHGEVVLAGTAAQVAEEARGGASSEGPSADEVLARSALELSAEEAGMLAGERGRAVQVAMRILARAAAIQGAEALMAITQAHIDACTYIGPGGLRFAQTLAGLGARVAVPTTLNSTSVDRRQWRQLGVPPALGEPAQALGDAYLQMGCSASSFTCAPYLLASAPALGDQIAWGESNAVVYANSVLGARTQKYADYLDLCAALTARAPAAGPHLPAERRATVALHAGALAEEVAAAAGDAFWPVLGYLCGLRAEARVPVVCGLTGLAPSSDDLKAFSAAFGTTAAAPMFHLAGITPEAPDQQTALGGVPPQESVSLTAEGFASAWRALDSGAAGAGAGGAGGGGDAVELVAVGNPHLSLAECGRLAALVRGGGARHPGVEVVATMGRAVFAEAEAAGHTAALQAFGVRFVTDTCWCMLTEPVVPPAARTLITNSAKYAHYAPALVARRVRFASLQGCVEAARTGKAPAAPTWLAPAAVRGFASGTARMLHPPRMGTTPLAMGKMSMHIISSNGTSTQPLRDAIPAAYHVATGCVERRTASTPRTGAMLASLPAGVWAGLGRVLRHCR